MTVYVGKQPVSLTSFLMSVDDDIFSMMIQSTHFRSVQEFVDRYCKAYEMIFDDVFKCI